LKSVTALKNWRIERNKFHHSRTAQATEPPGHKPLVVNGVVVGPFEEEEEGTGVASDVVKVEGEDPATTGPLT